MDFFQIVNERRSIRAFEQREVEEDKVRRILDAANKAPSAGNLQAYEIFLTRDAATRKALAAAARWQSFVADAPLVLVFCAHPARAASKYGQRGVRLYAVQDATIACTFAMLAAAACGLATVWVGAFEDEHVREAIHAPEGILPVGILPIGYAAEIPGPFSRRNLGEIVHTVV